MLRTGYEAEIIRNIHLLEKGRQKSVLSYIKSLLKGSDNKNLLKFAGAFSPEDIKEMEEAISQGCENIDSNEW